jgi:hypothetical protein
MATSEHVPRGVCLVTRMKIRADRHTAGRSQLTAARFVLTKAARAPPARPASHGPSPHAKAIATAPKTRVGPVEATHRPDVPRMSPPPKPSKEEIMETPHCTSATAVLGMPPSRSTWHSDMEPGP